MKLSQEPTLDLRHLLADVLRLAQETSFPFSTPTAASAADTRTRLISRVSAHVLPRLDDDAAPAAVVLGGSTGAGKSTLLNSLVGQEVSPSGVVRPTTTRPVVVHALARQDVPLSDVAQAVANPQVPHNIVLVDAPDLDSLDADNRELAERLLDAADLWVFVTSAARYGDQLPWRHLVAAKERGLQVAVVLNRVPEPARAAVRADLLGRLDLLGLGGAPLFLIPDISPHEGPLPQPMVAELAAWLHMAAGRQQSLGLVRRTGAGVWRSVQDGLIELAAATEEQAHAAAQLGNLTVNAVRAPQHDMERAIADGQLAHGAATTRWLALASARGPLAALVDPLTPAKVGWRGAARAARGHAVEQVAAEVIATATTLLVDAICEATAAIRAAWQDAGAEHLMTVAPCGREAATAAATAVLTSWEQDVDALLDVTAATPREQLKRMLPPESMRALAITAAAGVPGAEAAAGSLIGERLAVDAREALQGICRQAIAAAAAPYLQVVRTLPTADHAARLRVRAAEMRGHYEF